MFARCVIFVGLLVGSGASAWALTAPKPGGVARPFGLILQAPFPCGTKFMVTTNYGLSTRLNDPGYANDYYALNFVRDEVGGGFGKPVVAVAAGTVRYADWAKNGWKGYGYLVIVEHDFKDGHSYSSAYGLLNSIAVKTGQKLTAGQTLGTLGKSGEEKLDFYKNPSLHFAMYRDSQVGSGGPYGGASMVPEPLGGAQDLAENVKAVASCATLPDGGVKLDGTVTEAGMPPKDGGVGEALPARDQGPVGDGGGSGDGRSTDASATEGGGPARQDGAAPPPLANGEAPASCAALPGATAGRGLGLLAALGLVALCARLAGGRRRRR